MTIGDLVRMAIGVVAFFSGPGEADGALLTGRKLVLERARLEVVSRDPAIDLGGGPASADDPTLHGGSLRVLSVEGDVFDTTYPLPASGWRASTRRGVASGWSFRGEGPVRSVKLVAGRRLAVKAKGALEHTLGADPAPVRVVLTLGAHSWCMEFGGEVKVRPGVRFRAADAAAPVACPLPYGEDSAWLCRPDRAGDPCLEANLDATVIEPDLATHVEAHVPAADPAFDCFHVYPTSFPTAEGTPAVGNQLDVNHPQYVSTTLTGVLAQAARFSRVCRVFVPHYRQATILALFAAQSETFLALAERDVRDAWRLYLKRWNAGRPFVVMGHSQGTEMALRILKSDVDPSPELRSRLVAAILLGGEALVADGSAAGGSFANLPLCTAAEQNGCVLAFRTYEAAHPPENGSNDLGGPGRDVACTNPASPDAAATLAPFTGSYFPIAPYFPGPATPYVKLAGFWSGRCAKDATNKSYLAISHTGTPGDQRTDPFPYDDIIFSGAVVGTHILDFNWGLGDLIDDVGRRGDGGKLNN